jgi:fatty-acyl-CoA synthase
MAADEKPWVDGLTLGQVLRETARRRGDAEAIIFPQAALRWSWRELDAAVDRCARGLLGLGFQSGDHFGVWSTNWPQWIVLQFATARVGVVLVTINPAYRAAELAYTLTQADLRGLALIETFKTSNYDALLSEVCHDFQNAAGGRLRSKQFPKLELIVRLRGNAHDCMLPWAELERAGASVSCEQLAAVEAGVQPDEPVNLQYTSGTTGQPKGALLTHRNLLLNAYYASEGQRLTPDDRVCIPVPLYHCFGCVLGVLCATTHGATMVFPHETFQAEATLAAVEAERCTALYGVPTMFIAQLEHPSYPQRDLKSLRTGIMAGSPCPLELMKRVTGEMGARELTIAYGQTEASPLITMTRTDDPLDKRVSTIGRALPGIEVKIIDPATGATLPDNQSGELCCRGHDVMLGYYNNREATAAAIDSEGWLHTGDLALRQPDGYFRITGRQKDMIIRGGENIAPREIEELLFTHPLVEEAHVIGVPDVKFGEEVAAFVRLKREATATVDEIRDFCRARLAHFKVPRYVLFVDQFPATVTGKIQKFKLREQAIEALALQAAAKTEYA